MSLDVSMTPQASPAPILKADMRPTADIAAMVRDPQPAVPMPIPASNGQMAAVAQSSVARKPDLDDATPVDPTERVLKPYGVTMLPNLPDPAEAPKDDASEAANTTETGEAKQAAQPAPETPAQTPQAEDPTPVVAAQEADKPAPAPQDLT